MNFCPALSWNSKVLDVQTELLVALLSGAIALGSAALAIYGQFNSTRLANKLENLRLAEQRRLDSEKVVARYREPLARAAYDFQSRLYNILKQDLLGVYFENGDDRERSYTVNNTTFVVAQYLAWTEIIRREIQYIDLGEDEKTRKLARLQDDVYALFQNDLFDKCLRIFAGEQRAIGERMIIDGAKGPECMGYATFLDQLSDRADPLIEMLRTDVRNLSSRLQGARPRLVSLQHALIDLLAFLDPDCVRFPEARRTKVSEANEAQ